MDNNKNYKWSPEDKIEITGIEFDIFQKTISMFEGAPLFAAASKVRGEILQRMISEGIAQEFDPTDMAKDPISVDKKEL